MYSEIIKHELTLPNSIKGDCLGIYVYGSYVGLQVEDDGSWFNLFGPFLFNRSFHLIEVLNSLVVLNNNHIGTRPIYHGPFALDIDTYSSTFSLSLAPSIESLLRTEYTPYHEKTIGIEYKPECKGISLIWVKDIEVCLPHFYSIINTDE